MTIIEIVVYSGNGTLIYLLSNNLTCHSLEYRRQTYLYKLKNE